MVTLSDKSDTSTRKIQVSSHHKIPLIDSPLILEEKVSSHHELESSLGRKSSRGSLKNLEWERTKSKELLAEKLLSMLVSIKFSLSVIIIVLILVSTICIFVATFILQGYAIDESTISLGSQTKLRTLDFVNNFIKYPFKISESMTQRISKFDPLSPAPNDWKYRIEELITGVVSFELSYASFTSKDDYFFGISRNVDPSSGSDFYILEYYRDGWYYIPLALDSNFNYNITHQKLSKLSIQTSEWWVVPQQTRKKSWSSPYATVENNKFVWISAFHPIFNNEGVMEFVITIDLTVNEISTYLKTISLSPHSYIYVVSSTTSEMIACSSNDTLYVFNENAPHKLFRKRLSESSIEDVKALGQLLMEKYGINIQGFTNQDNKYTVNGNTYLLNMVSVDDNLDLNWNVIIIMSVDDFMDPVILFRNIVLIADGCILFSGIVIAIAVSFAITAPLVTLGKDMEDLAHGEIKDLKHKKSLIVFHEVKKLRNHFNKMAMTVQGFMRYVPKEIVSSVIESDDQTFDLGVQQKHIAILFSDIKNFTAICEIIEPIVLIKLLEKYFELTSEVVYRNKGVLDKYIGDSLMVLFGAPDTYANYVFHGCNAAYEMQIALKPYNEQLEHEGRSPFHTRVGVSCGDVLVGNIGSTYRLSYTCLGDSVNLASRLEGLNKDYGTNIMVSEDCYQIVKDAFHFRLLDVVAVKGKASGVKVYELVGKKADDTYIAQDRIDFCTSYATILEEYYLKRRFAVAERSFREYAERFNQNNAALMMAERCINFIKHPPMDNWNGVHFAEK